MNWLATTLVSSSVMVEVKVTAGGLWLSWITYEGYMRDCGVHNACIQYADNSS